MCSRIVRADSCPFDDVALWLNTGGSPSDPGLLVTANFHFPQKMSLSSNDNVSIPSQEGHADTENVAAAIDTYNGISVSYIWCVHMHLLVVCNSFMMK